MRIDNDIFTGTDRDYTSGVQVGSTSATVESFDDAPDSHLGATVATLRK